MLSSKMKNDLQERVGSYSRKTSFYREIVNHKVRCMVNACMHTLFQGLTHSALGLYGRFAVLFRL
jgi:hypothetical protein